MKKTVLVIPLLIMVNLSGSFSQNTVGLVFFDDEKSVGGYNLIYPERQSTVFLLNQCGEVVHTWEDDDENQPGKTAYLTNDGHLLRSKNNNSLPGIFNAGGTGGIVELLSWENEILWSDTLATGLIRQHHDVHPMENGNVLTIAWEKKFLADIVENGFDTATYSQTELWPDFIREINPSTGETVWEWHAWDHMVQDHDSTKLNFGNVLAHPERIDINYQKFTANKFDWLHSNAIDYNPVTDQILLSVRNFNEIWIIDHSTTTEEAAGHTGGNSGRGGDLLFRWGNPDAYQQGTADDRQLYSQHDAQWVDDFVDADYEHLGQILLFNNEVGDDLSLGHILEPQWDQNSQSYAIENGVFLPANFVRTFSHPDSSKGFSPVASSIQLIEQGHVIMCAAQQGFSFELDENGGVVWEYVTPLKNGFSVEQGTELLLAQNFTFQLERYPEYFSGFNGKDLTPKGHIELSPNASFCTYTDTNENLIKNRLRIFPNPTTGFLIIENSTPKNELIIFNSIGEKIFLSGLEKGENIIDLEYLPAGIYFLQERKNKTMEKIIVVK